MIISARYTSAEHTSIEIAFDDGVVSCVPQPCETYHQQMLDTFLADGGTVEEPE